MNGKINWKKLVDELADVQTVKLDKVVPLSDFKDQDVRDLLSVFYEHNDPVINRIGTLFNASLSQGIHVFIVSKHILNRLVSDDVNISLSSCNTNAYNALLSKSLSKGWLVKLREPVGKKAGIYEVKQPQIADIFRRMYGNQAMDAVKSTALSLYDSCGESKNDDDNFDQLLERAKKNGYVKRRK